MTPNFVKSLDEQGLLKRNFDRPPIKDTVALSTGGYGIFRFIADNPGIWMLHCHTESHSDSGMMLMIKVGAEKDLPKKPKNWPTCGSYVNKACQFRMNSFNFYFLLMMIIYRLF